jgi:hypothetical protein
MGALRVHRLCIKTGCQNRTHLFRFLAMLEAETSLRVSASEPCDGPCD